MTSATHHLLTLPLLCLAASAAPAQRANASPQTTIPGFRVAVTYSPMASLELKRRHESVVIFGYTFGSPTKQAPRSLISEEGDIGLGNIHVEFQPGQSANIPILRIDQNKLKFVTPDGIQVLINVVSGRKSSPDNLLNCGIYEGPLQPVQSKAIPIHCKLISEAGN